MRSLDWISGLLIAKRGRRFRSHKRVFVFASLTAVLLLSTNSIFPQRRSSAPQSPSRSLTITTEPNAIIWIDDIRRAVYGLLTGAERYEIVDASGEVLTITYDKLLEIYFQNPQFGYYFLVLTSQRLLENLARAEAIIAQNKIAPQTPFAN